MNADPPADWRRRAVVEERKLTEYLLSTSHGVGRFKARFLMRLGFDPGAPEVLREALLEHVAGAFFTC